MAARILSATTAQAPTGQVAAQAATLQHPAELSDIEWLTVNDADFATAQQVYSKDMLSIPAAIVRPSTAAQVARVVCYATSQHVPFAVRVGGHGLGWADNVLCIDLRKLDGVSVAEDGKTATISGGALTSKVVTDLSARGLMTAVAHHGDIGYAGWATQGGWGPFVNSFGFGVDQIVGATVVDAAGKIVEADKQMLRGIRGGSGSFGVIVDLTVKVYELENVLAGFITLDAQAGIAETFAQFVSGLEQLYDQGHAGAATIEPQLVSLPGQASEIRVAFVWASSDVAAGQACLDKVLSLASVAQHTVAQTPTFEFATSPNFEWVYGQFGKGRIVNIKQWSEDVEEVVQKVASAMPTENSSSVMLVRPVRQNASTALPSVFNPEMRQSHFMVELVSNTADESSRYDVNKWTDLSYRALRSCNEAMSAAQPTMMEAQDQGADNVFGAEVDNARSLKAQHDPAGVFKHAAFRI